MNVEACNKHDHERHVRHMTKLGLTSSNDVTRALSSGKIDDIARLMATDDSGSIIHANLVFRGKTKTEFGSLSLSRSNHGEPVTP